MEQGQYIMALDAGTTSNRCILFDRKGKVCSLVQREFQQIYPHPGWVEQNPMEIWSTQIGVAAEAMGRIGAGPENIAAIGITNQRETTIVWDRYTGKPVYNAIVWQCRRTSPIVEELVQDGVGDRIREKTGLIPDPYFSATKLKWILDHVPGSRELARKGRLLFGTVDSWLIWNLTGGDVHVTDYTNASRTMMFDIHNLCWDQEILEKLGIPEQMLPEVVPSSYPYGRTKDCLIGDGIPICGAAGDQQSALFGQCCFDAGDVKNTYGTGCFMLMNTGNKVISSSHGLLSTIAVSLAPGKVQYALEGSVFVAGASIQWLRDELKIIPSAPESERYCREVEDTDGCYVVPAFTGLGAPYWNSSARGMIVGLTRGTNRSHLVRATVESLAYQTADVLTAMEKDSELQICNLKVDGGASANDFLMKFQSDLLNTEVTRPECVETTAMGAAFLAGLCTGFWKDKEELRENWSVGRVFEPTMTKEERKSLLGGWHRAVAAALAWADYRA
ncbi:MAG: glycerol kinase GlpK [Lachnospiraceae bacterium]|nr:glycerol kinase GlpK [Lachnospiraceae bacterium]